MTQRELMGRGAPRLEVAGSLREVAERQARSRRKFLREVAGAAVGAQVFGVSSALRAQAVAAARAPKVVVVTFGGGARDAETFAPDGQENIPHMLRELIPRATFYTQVVNRGILGALRGDRVAGDRRVRELQQLCGGTAGEPDDF